MKTNLLISLPMVLVVALMTQGCYLSTQEISFKNGQFTNSSGHVTGSVSGVKIEIREASGAQLDVDQTTTSIPGKGAQAAVKTCEIKIGKVEMSLVESDGFIKLYVNGKPYGEVKAGDSVLVDKAGAVTVNGNPPALSGTATSGKAVEQTGGDQPATGGEVDQ